jgi:AraC-like DNA-binding protein
VDRALRHIAANLCGKLSVAIVKGAVNACPSCLFKRWYGMTPSEFSRSIAPRDIDNKAARRQDNGSRERSDAHERHRQRKNRTARPD